jgi:DNA gyrase subunit A
MLATSHGSIRRNKLTDFQNIRANGLIAMKLDEGESLVSVKIAREDEDVFLASKKGKAIRFQVDAIRVFASRASKGVRGMKLGKGDEVMSMSVLKREAEDAQGQALLCVSEKGMGKRTYASEYRTIGRGGQGVVNMKLTDKTGDLVATFPVTDDHQVMLISDAGQMIRMPVKDVRYTGRSAQGVTLFKVAKDEKVVSVAWLVEDDEEDEVIEAEMASETDKADTSAE